MSDPKIPIPADMRETIFNEGLRLGRNNREESLGPSDWPGDMPGFIRENAIKLLRSTQPGGMGDIGLNALESGALEVIESELEDIFIAGYREAFVETGGRPVCFRHHDPETTTCAECGTVIPCSGVTWDIMMRDAGEQWLATTRARVSSIFESVASALDLSSSLRQEILALYHTVLGRAIGFYPVTLLAACTWYVSRINARESPVPVDAIARATQQAGYQLNPLFFWLSCRLCRTYAPDGGEKKALDLHVRRVLEQVSKLPVLAGRAHQRAGLTLERYLAILSKVTWWTVGQLWPWSWRDVPLEPLAASLICGVDQHLARRRRTRRVLTPGIVASASGVAKGTIRAFIRYSQPKGSDEPQ